jgi:hypothetical protein
MITTLPAGCPFENPPVPPVPIAVLVASGPGPGPAFATASEPGIPSNGAGFCMRVRGGDDQELNQELPRSVAAHSDLFYYPFVEARKLVREGSYRVIPRYAGLPLHTDGLHHLQI